MFDQVETTTILPTAADRPQPGALAATASPRSAPHDGLLLLAALTGHRGLLTAWLRSERRRARAGAVGMVGGNHAPR